METITLDGFLATYFPNGPVGIPNVDMHALLMATRNRELTFRRLLPAGIVRRLDKGFARSNTVHPDTAMCLYRICRQSNAKTVFETGTYWGYSTAYLALGMDGRPDARIWTFDLYARAGRHIPKALRGRIELVRGKPATESMPAVLAHKTPDIFFQDSRHDYEGVRDELLVVLPHLRPGAVVLFHDFIEPMVRQAAADFLKEFDTFLLENQDPQQMGVAIKR